MNMTVKQLRAFILVAELESFSLAARRLHLTPGAISLLVREFEAEVGFSLFDRTTRRVALSKAGRDFFPSANRALNEIQAAAMAANDIRLRASGVVQVAAPLVISSSLLPPVIAAYRAKHPDVRVRPVDCSTQDLVSMVGDDRADLAIGPDHPTGEGVLRIKLHDCPWGVWCPGAHRFATKSKVNWSSLNKETVIAAGRDPETVIERAFRGKPGEARLMPAYLVENMTTALGLASAGLGVAIAPTYVAIMAKRMGLIMRRLEEPIITRELSVYVSTRRAPTPAIATFLEFVRSHLAVNNIYGLASGK